MQHILLIEDDPILGNTLKILLSKENFLVSWAQDIQKAKKIMHELQIHLILLDINLGDDNGIDYLIYLRSNKDHTPIIMLTAQSDEDSVAHALMNGANDYVKKPFGNKELLARINVCLRNPNILSQKNINIEKLSINLEEHKIFYDKKEIDFSRSEFDILVYFSKNFEKVLTRENIIAYINNESISDRTVDSHISHIRQKLKKHQCTGLLISSVYGVGYRMEKN